MFKLGDKVRVSYDNTEYTIEEKCNCNDIFCDFWRLDDGKVYQEASLSLVNPTCLVPAVARYTIGASVPSHNSQYKKVMLDLDHGLDLPKVGVDLAHCSHDFKKYVGLMESFEYCTKCDQKRGHL